MSEELYYTERFIKFSHVKVSQIVKVIQQLFANEFPVLFEGEIK